MRSRKTGFVVLAIVLTLSLLAAIQLGCQNLDPVGADGLTGGDEDLAENTPPETYLALVPDPGQTVTATASAKTVNWWAEDADGWVESYLYRWGIVENDTTDSVIVPVDTAWYDSDWAFVEEETWIGTNQEEMDFVLPIRTPEAVFILQVKAVDNSGLVDPDPAEISFPIYNSRPSVEFRLTSNPTSLAGAIFYTFPVRSFVWDATDPDGNSSIAHVYYALDPQPEDTNWVQLSGVENSVSLEELEPGSHVFWLRVQDVAGFNSAPIIFPDSNNTSDPDQWIVKVPAPGGRLIVDDYLLESSNDHIDFYKAIYDSIYGDLGVEYSVWTLGNELPYVASDVTATLAMFDQVLWYSSYGQPMLKQAFNAMYSFINTPGNRMLLTTMVVDTGMTLDVAESVYRFTQTEPVPLGLFAVWLADTVFLEPESPEDYPELKLREYVGRPPFGLNAASGADVVYSLDPDSSAAPQYSGTPIVCVQRPDKSYTLMTIPLKLIDDRPSVGQFIKAVFDDE